MPYATEDRIVGFGLRLTMSSPSDAFLIQGETFQRCRLIACCSCELLAMEQSCYAQRDRTVSASAVSIWMLNRR